MKAHIAAVVLISIAAVATHAAGRKAIDVPLTKGALISASAIDDDGRGWLAVATPEPWRTDLYRISRDGAARDASLDGVIVKGIRPLAGADRYLIQGAAKSGPFWRVVHAEGGRLHTLWDSSRIPASFRAGEHLVAVSEDASRWAVASFDERELRVAIGLTNREKPRTTIVVESPPVELPDGFEYDGAGLEFAGGAGDEARIAVLWRGRVFVIDGEKIVASFVPPNGGASLTFDAAKSTLTAISSRTAAAYDTRDLTKPATVTEIANTGRGTRIVSRGGKSVLELPEASQSRTVYLHTD